MDGIESQAGQLEKFPDLLQSDVNNIAKNLTELVESLNRLQSEFYAPDDTGVKEVYDEFARYLSEDTGLWRFLDELIIIPNNLLDLADNIIAAQNNL